MVLEVIDVDRPESLVEVPFAVGVVVHPDRDVLNIGVATTFATGDGLGDGDLLHELPKELDVEVMLSGPHRAVMQLARRELVEFLEVRHAATTLFRIRPRGPT